MERNLKRISDELKLPQDSRERIRSQLSAHDTKSEDIPVKKKILKSRVPLIIAAVVAMMALTLTAGAEAVKSMFHNDILVPSLEDAFEQAQESQAAEGSDGPTSFAVVSSPGGTPPTPLEEMVENDRFKSDDWETGERIAGGVTFEYTEWESAEVISSDPALRSRRVTRGDGAEKMEYTAENPVNLLPTLTGRVTFDLTWMGEHYDYVPDADMAFVVADPDGAYVSELFSALYAKPDESGYVEVKMWNVADEKDNSGPVYIVEGSYETAYYYTTTDGYQFLITIHKGRVSAVCVTDHARISLYGAYLTTDEVEDILDNLSLSIQEEP